MRFLELSARGWRNLEPLSFEPGPSVNVFFGANAQGKTNLLEAIYYVATLRSFRTVRPSQMIAWGGDRLSLSARTEMGGLSTHLAVQLGKNSRELLVDGSGVEASEDYFGGFNVVVFTPEHLGLVRGEPVLRRQFMDRALFHLDRSQLGLVRRYNRLLKERNACLRRYAEAPRRAQTMLDAVDPQLSEVGSCLAVRRQRLLMELSTRFQEIHGRVSGGEKEVALRYRARGLGTSALKRSGSSGEAGVEEGNIWVPGVEEATAEEPEELCAEPTDEEAAIDVHRQKLSLALSFRREEDLRRGFTSVGPHQDDLELRIGGRSARHSASQGETRTLVLALKLAEVELVRERRSEVPVLLLDDLGSELDRGRREELLGQVLSLGGQTFLTTVVPDSLPGHENHVYFKLDSGKLSQASDPGFPRRQGSENRL